MNKIYIIIALIILVVGAVFVLGSNREETTEDQTNIETDTNNEVGNVNNTNTSVDNPVVGGYNTPSTVGGTPAAVKTFEVIAKNFSFSPSTMKVQKGDIVRITLINENGNHDLVLSEFNAKTKVLGAGETQTIEFVADKTGTFEYYCSVGSHRAMGMKGSFIVE